jgi:peptide-methionine (S)-S-oxide reductase
MAQGTRGDCRKGRRGPKDQGVIDMQPYCCLAAAGGLNLLLLVGCMSGADSAPEKGESAPKKGERMVDSEYEQQSTQIEVATFGAGCFWCVEAVFQQLDGVLSVRSGYSGGHVDRPTYEQVCSGTSGHAEVCQVQFDPAKISYAKLLEVFWQTHNPTTPDRQGNDVGPQYRSVVFYHNGEQKELAEKYKNHLDATGAWDRPIVTEISPFTEFYEAEKHHQDYYRRNPRQSYCQFIIRPKLEKLRKAFSEDLIQRP